MKAVSIFLLLAHLSGAAFASGVTSQELATSDAPREAELRLLYFTASWCGPCQMMQHQTWPDSAVQAQLKRYRFQAIDIDASPELAQQWSVRSIPVLIFTDMEMEYELARASGFMDAPRMAQWLHDAGSKALVTLADRQASARALATHKARLYPLFIDDPAATDLGMAVEALYALLALRNTAETEAGKELDALLYRLAGEYPDRLLNGLLNDDLQVRVRVARVLEAHGVLLDPWADPEHRQKAVAAMIEAGLEPRLKTQ